jgi:hypothetical protein
VARGEHPVDRYEALMDVVRDRDEWIRTQRHKVMYRDESKVE